MRNADHARLVREAEARVRAEYAQSGLAARLLKKEAGVRDALADIERANERRTPADWDFACFHAAERLRRALGSP